jgi:hypothetical protein
MGLSDAWLLARALDPPAMADRDAGGVIDVYAWFTRRFELACIGIAG